MPSAVLDVSATALGGAGNVDGGQRGERARSISGAAYKVTHRPLEDVRVVRGRERDLLVRAVFRDVLGQLLVLLPHAVGRHRGRAANPRTQRPRSVAAGQRQQPALGALAVS